MYKDLNGDGKIDAGANTVSNPGDQKIIGNSTPRYFYGVELNASWKGFDFRMFVQGVGKRDYFSNTNLFWGANGIGNGQGWEYWGSIFLQPHLDYFRGDPNDPLGQNLNSYYPRPLFADRNHSTQTRYLLNAAYARLKNLQIGYSLPAAVTKKLGIQHLRVYVSGENLFTITKLTSLFDPETLDEGLYGGTTFRYPLSKVISLGASINF